MNPSKSASDDCECVVCFFITKGVSTSPFIEKLAIINKGRPKPSMKNLKTKLKTCTRHFNAEKTYEQYEWLTGCENRNKLFCWKCRRIHSFMTTLLTNLPNTIEELSYTTK